MLQSTLLKAFYLCIYFRIPCTAVVVLPQAARGLTRGLTSCWFFYLLSRVAVYYSSCPYDKLFRVVVGAMICTSYISLSFCGQLVVSWHLLSFFAVATYSVLCTSYAIRIIFLSFCRQVVVFWHFFFVLSLVLHTVYALSLVLPTRHCLPTSFFGCSFISFSRFAVLLSTWEGGVVPSDDFDHVLESADCWGSAGRIHGPHRRRAQAASRRGTFASPEG